VEVAAAMNMNPVFNYHLSGLKQTRQPLGLSRVELFLQFETCIRHTTLWELMLSKEITIPGTRTNGGGCCQLSEVISYMISRQENSKETVDSKMKLCADVLTNDIPAIERVCRELSEDERKNGVKYFEVSLNPYILLGDDKSDEKVQEVVSAVLSALAAAQEATGVRYGVVLQYSKGMKDEAKFLLSLCKDLKDENVVGIELAGYDFNIEEVISDDSENVDFLLFSPDDIDIFMEAKDNKIHRSVHAGAYCPSEVIFQAIEKLGAERIVFGYSVIEDNSLYQDCISNKIHFCTTPSFNYGPKGADKLYHPTVQFAEDNLSFSINTGYPAVTGTGMEAEIDLVKFWGLTETHLTKAVFNSARNAFMEDKKKKELQKELRKAFGLEDKVELEIMINHNCGMTEDDGEGKVVKVSF